MLFLDYLLSNGKTKVHSTKSLDYHSKEIQHPVIGNGQVYIVYDSKKSSVHDVLLSLKDYFRTTPDIFVCMDGITNRPPVDINKFEPKIKQIGRLVLVTSNWKSMETTVLKDPEVLEKVDCAIREGKCKFDIALSLDDCSENKEKLGADKEIQKYSKIITEQVGKDVRVTRPVTKICDRMIDLLSKN